MRDEVVCCCWVVEVCLSREGLDLSQSENESKPASSTEREGEYSIPGNFCVIKGSREKFHGVKFSCNGPSAKI